MSKRHRKHIKAILEWLKTELESCYEHENSSLKLIKNAGWGRNGFYFVFESHQIAVDIWYWNTGVFNVGAFDLVSKDMFMDSWFVPDDYDRSTYPEESEALFKRKVKELLIGLRHKTPELSSKLTDDIHSEILNSPKSEL